jgi:hypothetical protein
MSPGVFKFFGNTKVHGKLLSVMSITLNLVLKQFDNFPTFILSVVKSITIFYPILFYLTTIWVLVETYVWTVRS